MKYTITPTTQLSIPLAVILIFTLSFSLVPLVSAAPYRHRVAHSDAHSDAHPIQHLHRHGVNNETASTVAILPVDVKSGETDEDNYRRDGGEKEEGIDIEMPVKFTPRTIVVQWVVDRIVARVQERGKDGDGDEESLPDNTVEENESDDDEQVKMGDEIEERTSSNEDSISSKNTQQQARTDEDPHEKIRDIARTGRMQENNSMEGLSSPDARIRSEDGESGEGTEHKTEKRQPCTSGPGPDDAGREEGMAILMGWTALVGLVGILAIAPAG
ncbi:hypothetical protein ONS95_001942 [Cadophora gregata]|uniref:uncharacterized protein n=1 Tax=Cadophora gregata TaxID=51156 RepID=UPI0026DCFE4F|nr:uncharacterized protein ONS95_001942 [Cadophora gregata]KAK0111594.1 hypothetical protein ONS95_001942 [Cadophora gregata]KAK0111931.1 hypothetical protein ONS96_001195 [Cadophora gregata f. sp. sojae]